MQRNIARGVTTLLIVAVFSLSFLTIVPVEEAAAWNAHPCNCETEIVYNSDGSWSVKVTCDWYFHWNPLPHDWECP